MNLIVVKVQISVCVFNAAALEVRIFLQHNVNINKDTESNEYIKPRYYRKILLALIEFVCYRLSFSHSF